MSICLSSLCLNRVFVGLLKGEQPIVRQRSVENPAEEDKRSELYHFISFLVFSNCIAGVDEAVGQQRTLMSWDAHQLTQDIQLHSGIQNNYQTCCYDQDLCSSVCLEKLDCSHHTESSCTADENSTCVMIVVLTRYNKNNHLWTIEQIHFPGVLLSSTKCQKGTRGPLTPFSCAHQHACPTSCGRGWCISFTCRLGMERGSVLLPLSLTQHAVSSVSLVLTPAIPTLQIQKVTMHYDLHRTSKNSRSVYVLGCL